MLALGLFEQSRASVSNAIVCLAMPGKKVEIIKNFSTSMGSCEPEPLLQERHHLSKSNRWIFDISVDCCELNFVFKVAV